jgi:hypothetical protein
MLVGLIACAMQTTNWILYVCPHGNDVVRIDGVTLKIERKNNDLCDFGKGKKESVLVIKTNVNY